MPIKPIYAFMGQNFGLSRFESNSNFYCTGIVSMRESGFYLNLPALGWV